MLYKTKQNYCHKRRRHKKKKKKTKSKLTNCLDVKGDRCAKTN